MRTGRRSPASSYPGAAWRVNARMGLHLFDPLPTDHLQAFGAVGRAPAKKLVQARYLGFVGGYDELHALEHAGKLDPMLKG